MSGCPVAHEERGAAAAPASGCPVKDAPGAASPAETTDNPLNNMPHAASLQQVWPGQMLPLPTVRQASTIPTGEVPTPAHQATEKPQAASENPVWMYPSPQQMFNAMRRKGWADAREEDMTAVVAIHNAVNERSWRGVLQWEERHRQETPPKLLRFLGRPKDLSPKARVMSWIGYQPPFDRHDWFVQRGDGKEVRYVVDFYRGNAAKSTTDEPMANGRKLAMPMTSVYLDVRPALDSPQALWDRLVVSLSEFRLR